VNRNAPAIVLLSQTSKAVHLIPTNSYGTVSTETSQESFTFLTISRISSDFVQIVWHVLCSRRGHRNERRGRGDRTCCLGLVPVAGNKNKYKWQWQKGVEMARLWQRCTFLSREIRRPEKWVKRDWSDESHVLSPWSQTLSDSVARGILIQPAIGLLGISMPVV
jgi:hypothetical protein